MFRLRFVLRGAVIILLVGCTAGGNGIVTTTTTGRITTTLSVAQTSTTSKVTMSDEASTYLQTALDQMREHSINSDAIDWEMVEESAFRFAREAETSADTYPTIIWALGMLGDDHSVFLQPSEAESFTTEAAFIDPVVDTIDDRYGYVSVGRYLGDIGDQADLYAKALGEAIETVDPGVCGWVVDLKTDDGGNMWPMVAGLAPLLGEGTVGSFTYPDGLVETWRIEDGTTWWGDMAMVATSSASYPAPKPVAVLVGSHTASAGEAVTAAFHGGPDVVLVGEPTYGLTTSNEPVELSDGAIMMLTMSAFTDRNGVRGGHGVSIEPDIPTPVADSETVAIEWLAEQPDCLE
jgi:carboxyl-terminal processing protease